MSYRMCRHVTRDLKFWLCSVANMVGTEDLELPRILICGEGGVGKHAIMERLTGLACSQSLRSFFYLDWPCDLNGMISVEKKVERR